MIVSTEMASLLTEAAGVPLETIGSHQTTICFYTLQFHIVCYTAQVVKKAFYSLPFLFHCNMWPLQFSLNTHHSELHNYCADKLHCVLCLLVYCTVFWCNSIWFGGLQYFCGTLLYLLVFESIECIGCNEQCDTGRTKGASYHNGV